MVVSQLASGPAPIGLGSSTLLGTRLRHSRLLRASYVRQPCYRTSSALKSKGTKYDHKSVAVQQSVGEGSFGQVFLGTLALPNDHEASVVLKRVKSKVVGAQEMAEMEHLLNVYASSACQKAVAPFLGYVEVPDSGLPQGKLTSGLWLVWEYEGDRTLAYYLRRRDCIAALADDLEVEEELVIPTVMQQIFECLKELHNAGIVHRDVKPANIVFAEDEKRFKFIDLGAAADLRTGTNYSPTETILDPCYCPPEEYILPTDAPHLADKSSTVAMAMSPLLWSQHRPDCFDTWSCGVVLMQLALPFLRTTSALRNWRGTLARYGNDLEEWRAKSILSARQTALLDANDGLGWELAAGLLRPREIEVEGKGKVKFVNTGQAPRLTATAALKHPYIKLASRKQGSGLGTGLPSLGSLFSSVDADEAAPAGAPQYGSGSKVRKSTTPTTATAAAESAPKLTKKTSGGGKGLWQGLWDRVLDLEARVMQEATETKTQTAIVEQLRKDVKAGKVAPEKLAAEESTLKSMQDSLQSTVKDLGTAFSVAKGFFSSSKTKADAAAEESGSESRGSSGTGSGSSKQQQRAASTSSSTKPASNSSSDTTTASPSSGSGSTLASFATQAIYNGLKLTGMAVNAVSDLASSAEESLARAQQEAATQREARAVFIQVLQQLDPPLTFESEWVNVRPILPLANNPKASYSALTERQLRLVFDAFVSALKDAEQRRLKALETTFFTLLEDADVDITTKYATFAQKHDKDPRYLALADDTTRREAFKAYNFKLQAAAEASARQQLKAAEAAASAAQKAADAAQKEANFRMLLQENEEVVASKEWAQVKRALWADNRWDAVGERRRKALFTEYRAILEEAGVEAPEQTGQVEDTAQLEFLRAEQDRLKEEYDSMAGKLQAMEKQLQIQNLAGSLIEEVVVEESEQEVTFKFPEPVESTANGMNGTGKGNGGGRKKTVS